MFSVRFTFVMPLIQVVHHANSFDLQTEKTQMCIICIAMKMKPQLLVKVTLHKGNAKKNNKGPIIEPCGTPQEMASLF